MKWLVPLSDVDLGDEEAAAVAAVLRSKWLSMGEVTSRFEAEFARAVGAGHAVAVTNATAALHLAYAALGVGPGTEVIVPSLTFVATANAVLHAGGRPVFAEIKGPGDLNVCPESVARLMSPRTRAVVAVHYGGHVCDMEAISEIAGRHGAAVVEDAAHAPGARRGGRAAGTFGDAGCFSFFANKNLTTAEGGMIVTGRADLARRLRLMRSHGMTSATWDRHRGASPAYDVVELGYNYRIDEMRSALGLAQLKTLEVRNERRRLIAGRYRAELSGLPGLSVPFASAGDGSAQHLFPVLLDDPGLRPKFIESMRASGVQTSIHYPPVHLFEFYRERFGFAAGDLPVTEDVCSREVTLPLYPAMGDAEIEIVCAAVRRALGDAADERPAAERRAGR